MFRYTEKNDEISKTNTNKYFSPSTSIPINKLHPLTFSLVLPSVAAAFFFATPVITRPLALETRLDDLPAPTAVGPLSAATSDDDSDFDLDDFGLDVDSGLDDSDLDDADFEGTDFDGDLDLDDLDSGASDWADFDDGIGDSDVDVGVGPAAVPDLVPRDRPALSCDLYDVGAA